MPRPATIQDTLASVDSFLASFPGMPKQAAEGATNSFVGKETQTSLGKEQQAAAEDAGSTATTAKPNSEADDKKPTDNQGLVRMDSDKPVTEGNIGTIKRETIGTESELSQKAAAAVKRASTLGNAVMAQLAKEAGLTAPPAAAAAAPAAAPAANAAQVTAYEQFMQAQQKIAADYAQQQYSSFLYGRMRRLQDEAELAQGLAQGKIDQALLNKVGGVSGLLDKVAAETPEAVFPEMAGGEGAAAPGAGAPPDGAAAPGGDDPMAAAAAGAGDPGPGAGADPGAAGGGDQMADLAQQLEAAGVTAEDLEQGLQDLKQLHESGVTPEQLAQAVQEIHGGAGPDDGQKTAADRETIEAIKTFLTTPVK